tara:strand:- start:55 stop:585 length:531 start_codon:yes stop_codon:yes gene_type:complete
MSIVKSIDMALSRVKKTLGNPFPIPPKTAEAIRDRRKSLLHLDDLHGKYGMTHTGWTEFIAPANLVGVVDPVILHMMHVELSEMHNLPISLIAGLEYAVAHEPAKMNVYIKGAFALMHEGKGTPSLYRIAHEGAEDGMWEAEELLLLPPPLITIPMEMMEQLDNTNTHVGYDMEMA